MAVRRPREVGNCHGSIGANFTVIWSGPLGPDGWTSKN